jgi:hypothetical protein
MPFDLSAVNWLYVAILSGIAFVAALLGSLIAFRNRFAGAIVAGILFGVGFVAWNYYPHDFGLPVLKATGPDNAVVAPSPTGSPTGSPTTSPTSSPSGG